MLFMDGFDRFPVNFQMVSDLFDGQIRTQGKDVIGQSLGDPLSRINKVKLFDHGATFGTPDGSIPNRKIGFGFNTTEISHHSFTIGMNPFDLALTVMTYWVKAFVRVDSNGDQLLFFIKRLFFHRDSTKIKEWIKLYLGHRSASSGQFLLMQILYPEKQAVSIFISLFYQLFGRRTILGV